MKEHSFGVIPIRRNKSHQWEFLLIQHHAGHWGFPKGKAEIDEVPLQTASRELFEETGLTILKLLSESPLRETYFYTRKSQKIAKTVDYFLAIVFGKVALQAEEVKASKWVLAKDAENEITFLQGKNLCQKAVQLLKLFEKST